MPLTNCVRFFSCCLLCRQVGVWVLGLGVGFGGFSYWPIQMVIKKYDIFLSHPLYFLHN